MSLKELREKRGLSQHELSKRSGISQPYISKVETRAKDLGMNAANKIANVLDCSIDELIGRDEHIKKA